MYSEMVAQILQDKKSKEAVLYEWEKYTSSQNLDAVREDMLATDCAWFQVKDTTSNEAIAVFDIRNVPSMNEPQYHKSLRIHFAPGLNPEECLISANGLTIEQIEQTLQKVVSALSEAFACLLRQALETQEQLVKIYCEHPLRFQIFKMFAQNLSVESPSTYSTKIYKNWVEIKRI